MTYVLPFGKYKGHTVGDVLTINPDWLLWAEENVSWFRLTDKVRNIAESCSDNIYREAVDLMEGFLYYK